MFSQPRGRPLPPWVVNALALALVLASSAVLNWVLRDGKPDRRILTAVLGMLLLVPGLLRWQAAWMMLFVVIPWVAWLRRVQLVLDPANAGIDRFDLILLVPDVLTGLAVLGYLMAQRFSGPSSLQPGEGWLRALLLGLVGICLLEVVNPVMGSVAAGINGLRVFTLYIGLYWVTAHVCEREERIHTWIGLTLAAVLITGLY
ncbi:MAG: hypothetical protein VKQ33_15340, partial [Candidatus Sericytochromatia bacterium]|nr:hypothetical protein [Candidatus Sericytochromatia bacterium]